MVFQWMLCIILIFVWIEHLLIFPSCLCQYSTKGMRGDLGSSSSGVPLTSSNTARVLSAHCTRETTSGNWHLWTTHRGPPPLCCGRTTVIFYGWTSMILIGYSGWVWAMYLFIYLFNYFNIFTQGSPLSNMLISRGALEHMVKTFCHKSIKTFKYKRIDI